MTQEVPSWSKLTKADQTDAYVEPSNAKQTDAYVEPSNAKQTDAYVEPSNAKQTDAYAAQTDGYAGTKAEQTDGSYSDDSAPVKITQDTYTDDNAKLVSDNTDGYAEKKTADIVEEIYGATVSPTSYNDDYDYNYEEDMLPVYLHNHLVWLLWKVVWYV